MRESGINKTPANFVAFGEKTSCILQQVHAFEHCDRFAFSVVPNHEKHSKLAACAATGEWPGRFRPRVQFSPLNSINSKFFLNINFSDNANDALLGPKTDELRRYAITHGIETLGESLLAFYNPPWTLPFFRRNKVMIWGVLV